MLPPPNFALWYPCTVILTTAPGLCQFLKRRMTKMTPTHRVWSSVVRIPLFSIFMAMLWNLPHLWIIDNFVDFIQGEGFIRYGLQPLKVLFFLSCLRPAFHLVGASSTLCALYWTLSSCCSMVDLMNCSATPSQCSFVSNLSFSTNSVFRRWTRYLYTSASWKRDSHREEPERSEELKKLFLTSIAIAHATLSFLTFSSMLCRYSWNLLRFGLSSTL